MQSYSNFSKLLHWATALLIFALLWVGFYMEGLDDTPFKFEIYGLHKSFGTLVLVLVIVRIGWKIISAQPEALTSHSMVEKMLAKLVKLALVVGMIAMPLSGWIMSNAGGYPYQFFGLFEMPQLVGKDKAIGSLAREIHELAAFGIIGALLLHMVGAFKHHFVDRDETLKRMTSLRLGFLGGFGLLLLFGTFWLVPVTLWLEGEEVDHSQHEHEATHAEVNSDTANEKHIHVDELDLAEEENLVLILNEDVDMPLLPWLIMAEESEIKFIAKQFGSEFEGEFKIVASEIFFGVNDLENSKAVITIDVGSIATGEEKHDEQARSVEWFDVASFPRAQFISKSFRATDEPNRFAAIGDLKLKNIEKEIEILFNVEFYKDKNGIDYAHMKGGVNLNRNDFNIGADELESSELIESNVEIVIDLQTVHFE